MGASVQGLDFISCWDHRQEQLVQSQQISFVDIYGRRLDGTFFDGYVTIAFG
jgi:hypothetical protein